MVVLYSLWRQPRDCCHYPNSGTVCFSHSLNRDSQEIAVIILTAEQCVFSYLVNRDSQEIAVIILIVEHCGFPIQLHTGIHRPNSKQCRPGSDCSYLGLHCLSRPVCPKLRIIMVCFFCMPEKHFRLVHIHLF